MVYATTFCNMGHDLKTGKPIGHECYILPVAALVAERNDDFETANLLISTMKRRIHKGLKEVF